MFGEYLAFSMFVFSSMLSVFIFIYIIRNMPHMIYNVQVFFPLAVYLRVCRIFECSRDGPEKGFLPKQGRKIDYEMLGLGGLQEVRHTFARVVFDTVYPVN